MKIANKIIVLAPMAVAMVFASCSKDDDVNNVPSQKEIETKIIGKWKKMKQDGNVVYIISPSVERTSTIPSISDSQMTMHVTKVLSHGIGIKADYVGEYSKVTKDGENWIPSTNADNEYNVDGDWLATRWRPEAGADYNYEWWDIDEIKDGMMKWSALREKEKGETLHKISLDRNL